MRKKTINDKMINTQFSIFNGQLRISLLILVMFFSCRQVNSEPIPKWKITDLQEYIAKSDKPLVVNFWATYCGPCIKEIPYFQEVVKQNEKKGVKLLLVSLDFKESFPQKMTVLLIKGNSLPRLFGLMKLMLTISAPSRYYLVWCNACYIIYK
jgi:thiol-disulfide isomerase/thioredoxin